MSNGTIIQQGSFTSAGTAVTLQVPSGVDWIELYNYTQMAAAAASTGYQFYWQLGMPNGVGFEYQSNAGSNAVFIVPTAAGAFTLVNSSINTPSQLYAITAGTNAARPVYTATITALSNGNIVRLINVPGNLNLSGYDFSVTAVGGGTFTIAPTLANAPGAVATGGNYRIIPFNPLFYPPWRYVVNISQAANAQVTTSVAHQYVVGQQVRLETSTPFGMVEINGLTGNILSIVDAYNFTVDINSSGFTAFTFPLVASVPFSPALVNPVGETANANISNPNLLDDATVNTGYIGIQLTAGINGPAGQANDVIFWKVGKSFNT